MRRTSELRRLVEEDSILVLPGVFDAVSGRLAQAAGFQALVAGGYAATASLIGAPDIGQLGMTEMAEYYARLCEAVALPVLADAVRRRLGVQRTCATSGPRRRAHLRINALGVAATWTARVIRVTEMVRSRRRSTSGATASDAGRENRRARDRGSGGGDRTRPDLRGRSDMILSSAAGCR
jgi:hypothetical protein